MGGTPEWQKEQVVAYFQATNERSYLANWSGKALSLHFGLSDESTKSLDEAHENSNRYLADHLAIAEGTDVLDAGCGVGGTSIWLAKERRANVVGITIDPQQVELATRFAAERGVSDLVSFEAMDFAGTTFDEGSFDVVFNLESLCHAFDAREYLAHVAGLIRSDGRYGCMDLFVGVGRPDLVEQVKKGWAMPRWRSMAEVTQAMKDEGFVDVTAVDLTRDVKRSAEQMIAMAKNTDMVVRLQHAIDSVTEPTYEGHVKGALAAAEGLLSGGVTYGFVSARPPPR